VVRLTIEEADALLRALFEATGTPAPAGRGTVWVFKPRRWTVRWREPETPTSAPHP
jgi:hypothetical protein